MSRLREWSARLCVDLSPEEGVQYLPGLSQHRLYRPPLRSKLRSFNQPAASTAVLAGQHTMMWRHTMKLVLLFAAVSTKQVRGEIFKFAERPREWKGGLELLYNPNDPYPYHKPQPDLIDEHHEMLYIHNVMYDEDCIVGTMNPLPATWRYVCMEKCMECIAMLQPELHEDREPRMAFECTGTTFYWGQAEKEYFRPSVNCYYQEGHTPHWVMACYQIPVLFLLYPLVRLLMYLLPHNVCPVQDAEDINHFYMQQQYVVRHPIFQHFVELEDRETTKVLGIQQGEYIMRGLEAISRDPQLRNLMFADVEEDVPMSDEEMVRLATDAEALRQRLYATRTMPLNRKRRMVPGHPTERWSRYHN
ncbi:MAG: hypothetical protein MHM6MM_002500 [Cercozoa sp. M6MM]